LLLLENVKGLLNHDGGRTFTVILQSLDELGYWVEWQVLNSKHFGVPQNRERVFIIGHLRGGSGREVFPITEISGSINELQGQYYTNTISGRGPDRQSQGSFIIESAKSPQEASRFPLKFPNRNEKNWVKDEAYTVDSSNTGGVIQNLRIRRLTPTECERLQGFPDNWTEGISDTQRYTCIGNAVTVNVIQFLGERIINSCR